MSVQVKRRREAAAFLAGFTGAQGELIVDTTNNRVQVHDGATAGGFPAAKLAEVLQSANNLSDLPNKSVALSNLGAVASTLTGAANGIATLDSTGHVPLAQLPAAIVGALQFQGIWNAATNTPALASGSGTKGYFYKVAVAGTTQIDGNSQWNPGDMIVFDGTVWDKLDGESSEVVSVAGLTGPITAMQILAAIEANTGTSGTGALVFATSPALIAPNLGTPSSLNLSNATALPAMALPAFTGDVTSSAGSPETTLATVNVASGTVGSSTAIPVLTTNAKGLVTAQTSAPVTAPANTLTGSTLAANVTESSLTSIGVLTAGTIPASLLSGTAAAAQEPAHIGDVTNPAGSLTLTISANAVTNAKAAQMPASTFKGNNTGATANASDLTAAQAVALLPAVAGDTGAGGTQGLVPAPPAGSAAFNLALGASGAFVGRMAGFRNRLRNANFSVNQRAVSGTVTLAAGAYGHDGIKAGASGAIYTFATSGIDTILTITSGSLIMPIEAGMIEGGVCTVSQAGTAQARVWQGTGVSGSGSFTSAPFQTFSLTAALQTNVEFSTGTVSKVQLEPGPVPSVFERRPPAVEFLLCQRYYQQLGGGIYQKIGYATAFTSSYILLYYVLPVSMRVNPTLTFSGSFIATGAQGNLNFTASNIVVDQSNPSYFSLDCTTSGSGTASGAYIVQTGGSGSLITLSAEL